MSLRLGKLSPKIDKRTIKMSTVLRTLPPIPDSFDVDELLGGLTDGRMFANDKFGDCVIAGQAHQTMRFEKFEQRQLIDISDEDVTTEYFKQTGGADNGLIMLDALNAWRRGWITAGQTYTIDAYGSVNVLNSEEVKAVMYLLRGLYSGFALPLSAKTQYNDHQTWDVVNDSSGAPYSWGGHCIYIKRRDKAITKVNYTCVTWGKEQEMTEDFVFKYCDEGFGIVDSLDRWIDPANNPLDVEKLKGYLQEIVGQSPLKITSLILPAGTVDTAYTGYLSASGGLPPYTWSLWSIYPGVLPAGLSLDSATGIITGTPTAYGSNQVVFLCTDELGDSTGVAITIQINEPSPTPSKCKWGNGIVGGLNRLQEIRGREGRFYYMNQK